MENERPVRDVDSLPSSDNHLRDAAINLLSGVAGGCVNVVVGLPMDTVKVKMQTFPADNPSALGTFARTFKTEGVFRGLYAGALPSLMSNVGENAVLFVAYGHCQKLVAKALGHASPEHMSPVGNALSGSSAAVFSSLLLCPTEHIKCQLQVRRELRKRDPSLKMVGPFQLTAKILKEEGIRGLYAGLRPTWSRELPGYFCFFGGYETTKLLICKATGKKKDELNLFYQLVCGAMAGVTFWTGIFPMDVVKSRIQARGEKGSIVQVARGVYGELGVRGFYNGLTPALLRAFPSTAALLATYEYTSYYLKQKFPEEEKE